MIGGGVGREDWLAHQLGPAHSSIQKLNRILIMNDMCSTYFVLEPEVPGELRDCLFSSDDNGRTIVEEPTFYFAAWPLDELITSHPCFFFSERLSRLVTEAELTGVVFASAQMRRSSELDEDSPGVALPPFLWGKIVGIAGKNDFGIFRGDLVVSERAVSAMAPYCPDGMTRVRPWLA